MTMAVCMCVWKLYEQKKLIEKRKNVLTLNVQGMLWIGRKLNFMWKVLW
jgi:hypothetical protein